ncbi:hypothetical protein ABTL66_19680, partial [Acinetobacter baumannii]
QGFLSGDEARWVSERHYPSCGLADLTFFAVFIIYGEDNPGLLEGRPFFPGANNKMNLVSVPRAIDRPPGKIDIRSAWLGAE